MQSPLFQSVFTRAVLDRNMTINTNGFSRALENIDLTGLAILDFGCGNGNLLRLLRHSQAATVYAFEVMPEHLDPDIQAWADDPLAKPRLIINPVACKIHTDAPDGDLTAYDYEALMSRHDQFAIISNPPYFLYNRILSLTKSEKFNGALMITSKGRLHNHPLWDIIGVMENTDFDPPAYNPQYLVQTGFAGRTNHRDDQPHIHGHPQPYPHINDRVPTTDMTDHYPEMWDQLNNLKNKPQP